ncbi:DUF5949 family protein [Streptomyces sp. NPDC051597]|uniref:DUF5949 family protein n=1 Tax=Streptomyces sp. NPDC051597 TaxID=3155049 RepID=UPI00343EA24C
MTSATSAASPARTAQLGTLSLLAWSGPHFEEDRDVAFLMVYPLGDGEGGAEGAEAAVRELLEGIGIPAGTVHDAAHGARLPMTLLLEGGQVTLTLPQLRVQCVTPPEWMEAARAEGAAHFIFTTRAWPEAVPGARLTEEAMRAFVGDERTLTGAGHCVLPVSRLRG